MFDLKAQRTSTCSTSGAFWFETDRESVMICRRGTLGNPMAGAGERSHADRTYMRRKFYWERGGNCRERGEREVRETDRQRSTCLFRETWERVGVGRSSLKGTSCACVEPGYCLWYAKALSTGSGCQGVGAKVCLDANRISSEELTEYILPVFFSKLLVFYSFPAL